jgi:GNAT superfamily N-acetyltransferase
MWPRTTRQEYEHGSSKNKCRLKKLVQSDRSPGLIAFYKDEPAGWSAVGHISEFPQYGNIENDLSIWAIACLFVSEAGRGRGIARTLVSAALSVAGNSGASTVYGPPQWWRPEASEQSSYITGLFGQYGFETVKMGGRLPLLRKRLLL